MSRGKSAEDGKQRCFHCRKPLGAEHGFGCLYAGPPRAADRKRTGVSGLVTEADCEGRGTVHTNASLGLLPSKPAMNVVFSKEQKERIEQLAARERRSQAQVVRILIEAALEQSARGEGPLPSPIPKRGRARR